MTFFHQALKPFSFQQYRVGNNNMQVNPAAISWAPVQFGPCSSLVDNWFKGCWGGAQITDVGHHNGNATPAGTRHQPLTCLNSWNVWHCLPPEICRATGKAAERKEEGEGRRKGDGRHGGRTGRRDWWLGNRGPLCKNGTKQELNRPLATSWGGGGWNRVQVK